MRAASRGGGGGAEWGGATGREDDRAGRCDNATVLFACRDIVASADMAERLCRGSQAVLGRRI